MHKKTFDREFCYNLDVNLAKIIARALKAYEKTVVGVPNDLCYAVVDGELKKIRTMDEAIEYWHKLLKQFSNPRLKPWDCKAYAKQSLAE